ncbi:hypothetical protein ACLMJK_001907 [Lecanora helva]
MLSTTTSSSLPDESENPPTTISPPVGIVGMACRVPGASNPSQLWENIVQQKDLQRKMPEDRFNIDAFYHPDGANKATSNARYGYFLDSDISEFDSEFFKISGKEAEAMDPQQRLLLEVTYEALEDAGITLEQISGTRTSVFCGCFTNDYRDMLIKDLEHYPKHTATGTGFSIMSNRISFFYNLHGPSVTLDTACSSALVGFHMAFQSICNGEADTAIVLGAALHFDPNWFLTMTDMSFLSSDGRCRAFDASGSGYVRGEGICAVVLKRKDLAHFDGNTLRAEVCGTSINHDGYKEGLTMPNHKAQESLIADLYKRVGLPTHETSYFEAHGTGTAAGDPREMRAIGTVFASSRKQPMYVGSVKTNIGHLEGASGLAGIIKTTLSLEAGKILPNMHFNKPNPNIEFEQWKVAVPTKLMDWEPINGVRRASINSFGYGGSNAHIILQGVAQSTEQLPNTKAFEFEAERPFLLPLTSHTVKAGESLRKHLLQFTQGPERPSAADIARNLSDKGRSLHKYRSFIVGASQESVFQKLQGSSNPWVRSDDMKPRLGFVFTGQGAQSFDMGRELIERNLYFRQTLERCDKVLQTLPNKPNWSCVSELLKTKENSRVNQFAMSSPLCCCIQIAIIDLLRQWGIEPRASIGHSSGEIPAAYAANILSFEDALTCAYQRGYVLDMEVEGKSTASGAMIAVGLSEDDTALELAPYKGRACIAAVNSYSSLTISGDELAILELQKSLESRQIFVRRLQVERAFHSHHMLPYAETLTQLTNETTPRPATCRMVSSVTGQAIQGPEMTGAYFARNLTGKVRFAEAVTGMLFDDEAEQDIDIMIEIGPHPALKAPSRNTIQSMKLDVSYLETLNRGSPAFESILNCAGQLFARGFPVDLEAVNSTISINPQGSVLKIPAGRKLRLPSYSWDHGKYWAETRLIRNHRLRKHRHPLLGALVPASTEQRPQWRRILRRSELPWLSDHKIEGNVIFPASGYLSMAVEAALRLQNCPKEIRAVSLRDISIKSAMALSSEDSGTEVLLSMQPLLSSAKRASHTWYAFSVCSFDASGACVEHCHGQIEIEGGRTSALANDSLELPLTDLRKRTNKSQQSQKYYNHLESIGLQYSGAFRLIDGSFESGNGTAIAPIIWHKDTEHALHPTFFDALLHPLFAGLESLMERPLEEPFVPTFMKSVKISGAFLASPPGTRNLWACSKTSLQNSRVATNNISIRSEDGNEGLIDLSGVEATALGRNSTEENHRRSLFFRTRWQPAFDCLAGAQEDTISTLAELMDVYAHQFPNSKILHCTSEKNTVKEALSCLGGGAGERRRFQSLTPFSDHSTQDWKEIEDQWPNLINTKEPEAGNYDLIILSEQPSVEVTNFLKPGGFIITDGIDFDTQDLSELFEIAGFSTWRDRVDFNFPGEPLTMITALDTSEDTENLASIIEASHEGIVTRLALSDLSEQGLHTQNVLVLYNLDENLCGHESAEAVNANFEASKILFENTSRNIIWVTRGASMESPNPEQAMVAGLARTARNENENLKIIVLDVDEMTSAQDATTHIAQILTNPLTEEEFAAIDGTLYIPRVEADDDLNRRIPSNSQGDTKLQSLGSEQPLALQISKVGLLETLSFRKDATITDANLTADEIEIEVKASSINRRDIHASMGAIDDSKLGDECAGLVVGVGSKVANFKVGDRVVAWRPGQGAHRTRVRNPASLCHYIGAVPYTVATTIPFALTSAYYALVNLARLQPDEDVLIHSAAGSVGQMAIQLAQLVGANVIVTCESQSERDLIRETYGLEEKQILSSRNSTFVEDIRKLTDGKGADVVLNDLTGDLLHASWKAVARFGRFVEIGKQDINENAKLDMEQFRKNVTFSSLDMVTVFEYNKPLGSRILKESMKIFEAKKISPPGPILELSYAEAEQGFRQVHTGKSTGKVVLVPHEDDLVPVSNPGFSSAELFDSQKTYLIVGGLGGLGRTLAEWMIRKGARSLAFMSRSGASTTKARETIAWLEARDVDIQVFAADVTDYTAVEECIHELGPQLGGIFHAAMVLQDAPLTSMNLEQWRACIRPKVHGAGNLHRATLHLDLDFFIPFSSVSATIGSLGQSNYAAANCYLDALVAHRREQGLKASTMNIGMVKGAGVVDGNDALEKIMTGLGSDVVTEDELLYQLQEAIEASDAPLLDSRGVCRGQTITGINLARKDYYWSKNSLFRNLYSNHDLEGSVTNTKITTSLTQQLHDAPDVPARVPILLSAFLDKISIVLGIAKELIQPSNALAAYGLDSIVAVELRKWFSSTVRVNVPLFDIINAKSITVLVEKAVALIAVDRLSESKGSKEKLVVTAPKATDKGKADGEALVQRWIKVDSRVKVPSVNVEVVEVATDGPSSP